MKKRILFAILTSILIVSCQKKIDGSTEESMKKSIEEINESLDESKKEEFQESMQLMMFNGLELADLMKEDGAENMANDFKTRVDGMTAEDIIEEGKKIKKQIEQKKKEQAKSEILELYSARENAEKDKQMLSKFEVKRSRFYIRKSGTYYITKEPIIELTVKNGTDQAVSRAYFTGTLASPERTIPWIKDDFNYEISGGLEPGEEVTWYLAPNMFSDWGEVDAPKDAILTVEVTQLDGANGDELYSTNNFGEDEQERLEELLKSYPEFAK
ncbi:hypothetical protein BWZ22_02480 [Seonamhaeicola sp. S2-3]|uniref:DUF6694 family lipoprotein n=1 Tax=Seonamhaeicola sp. S2-3 TaxID=1936081 RepID=UPI000972A86D|nr:DUF6694 family lipoprotein [Seonamhaeicola sp. S2-3]APY10168.1 hypothetical protein BWZ22_02480 [Seonamhaeicola sp. S2-3]